MAITCPIALRSGSGDLQIRSAIFRRAATSDFAIALTCARAHVLTMIRARFARRACRARIRTLALAKPLHGVLSFGLSVWLRDLQWLLNLIWP